MDFFPFILSLFLVLHLSGQSISQVEAHHHHHKHHHHHHKHHHHKHHHHKHHGHQHHRHHISKLFVFGDSYVDTGNIKRGLANSWKEPYGTTFPGKPAGRFSDGRVFTDYIAKYLKLKSPVPYSVRKLKPKHLKYGMNFAFGGTGVFQTLFSGPNMTTQIDFFEQQIKDKLYSTKDIRNSVALVSVAGNDYTFYTVKNGSVKGFPSFVAALINQTVTNLIRIKETGVRKVIMSGLQPLGCLPQQTAGNSFNQCNVTSNILLASHNNLLRQAINKLNQQTNHASSPFLFLNLHDSFMSVLTHPTTYNIKDRLKPCCVGLSNEYFCGSVDKNNVKKYLVCEDPKSAFFWDSVHPTEAGWHAVYNNLRITNALEPIYY